MGSAYVYRSQIKMGHWTWRTSGGTHGGFYGPGAATTAKADAKRALVDELKLTRDLAVDALAALGEGPEKNPPGSA
jgi:hypothetical protein